MGSNKRLCLVVLAALLTGGCASVGQKTTGKPARINGEVCYEAVTDTNTAQGYAYVARPCPDMPVYDPTVDHLFQFKNPAAPWTALDHGPKRVSTPRAR